MKRVSLLLALPVVLFIASPADAWPWSKPTADFYVSPVGDDGWSGTLAEPNRERTDGPFASIRRAQQAVRSARAAETADARRCVVLLRGGRYELEAPLLFEPADSNVTYRAYRNETPIVSGGRRITGWETSEDGIWRTTIPAVADGDWHFWQLFVNGRRATRCRSPNQGYFRSAGPLVPRAPRHTPEFRNKEARLGLYYNEGDLARGPGWEEMNLILFHSWTASVHWVADIDPDERIVRFTAPCGWPVGYWEKSQRYYIENVASAFDAAGEWLLERDTGTLSYRPLPGEDLARAEFIAPVCEQLVRIAGEPKLGLWVDGLRFERIAFQHAAWRLARDACHDGQSASKLNAAVTTNGSRNCTFRECEFAHLGQYAVWFAADSHSNTLMQCEIHDTGGGGVKIGEMRTPRREDEEGGHTVENCFIHHTSFIAHSGTPVLILRSSHNRIRHNDISECNYMAMGIGWSWGYAPSSAHHNLVENNHIHHYGRGVLSDLGGVYTLGDSPGTVIRNNHFHDANSYAYGGWGMYTDEGSTGVLWERNLIHDTKSSSFHQHYGKDNVLRGNILAFPGEGAVRRSKPEQHNSFTFEGNIVLTDNAWPLQRSWTDANFTIRRNVYWDISGEEELLFDGLPFEDWQAEGHDRGSSVQDPGFVNPAERDFRFRRTSPIHKLGLGPFIDLSKVGLYGPRSWTSKPRRLKHRPVDAAMKPPEKQRQRQFVRRIADGFEDTSVGEKPVCTNVDKPQKGAGITVTDALAASGKHSVLFQDCEGLKSDWMPHMNYRPNWRKGMLHGSFDVRLGEGAKLAHEWRDWSHTPYTVGPSLLFDADGTLKSGASKLMPLPVDTWINIRIVCPLGNEAAGTFDLTVTVDGTSTVFEELPLGEPKWNRVTWIGWSSQATTESRFHLDNLDFRRPAVQAQW